MKCTAIYNVWYRGAYHHAGEAFDIDPADAEEMRAHGAVEDNADEPYQNPEAQEEKAKGKPPKK